MSAGPMTMPSRETPTCNDEWNRVRFVDLKRSRASPTGTGVASPPLREPTTPGQLSEDCLRLSCSVSDAQPKRPRSPEQHSASDRSPSRAKRRRTIRVDSPGASNNRHLRATTPGRLNAADDLHLRVTTPTPRWPNEAARPSSASEAARGESSASKAGRGEACKKLRGWDSLGMRVLRRSSTAPCAFAAVEPVAAAIKGDLENVQHQNEDADRSEADESGELSDFELEKAVMIRDWPAVERGIDEGRADRHRSPGSLASAFAIVVARDQRALRRRAATRLNFSDTRPWCTSRASTKRREKQDHRAVELVRRIATRTTSRGGEEERERVRVAWGEMAELLECSLEAPGLSITAEARYLDSLCRRLFADCTIPPFASGSTPRHAPADACRLSAGQASGSTCGDVSGESQPGVFGVWDAYLPAVADLSLSPRALHILAARCRMFVSKGQIMKSLCRVRPLAAAACPALGIDACTRGEQEQEVELSRIGAAVREWGLLRNAELRRQCEFHAADLRQIARAGTVAVASARLEIASRLVRTEDAVDVLDFRLHPSSDTRHRFNALIPHLNCPWTLPPSSTPNLADPDPQQSSEAAVTPVSRPSDGAVTTVSRPSDGEGRSVLRGEGGHLHARLALHASVRGTARAHLGSAVQREFPACPNELLRIVLDYVTPSFTSLFIVPPNFPLSHLRTLRHLSDPMFHPPNRSPIHSEHRSDDHQIPA